MKATVRFTKGSYEIKEDLKKEGFVFDKDTKSWVKTYEEKKDFEYFYEKYSNPTYNGRKGARIFTSAEYTVEVEEAEKASGSKESKTINEVIDTLEHQNWCYTAAHITANGINESYQKVDTLWVLDLIESYEFISCTIAKDIDTEIWCQEMEEGAPEEFQNLMKDGRLYIVSVYDEITCTTYEILLFDLN